MSYKAYVALAIYITDIVLNLIAARKRIASQYAITKIFLMPLLLLTYFCFLPSYVRSRFGQITIVMALVFHCMGDTLLLFRRDKTKKYFYAGMVSFFFGHLFYSAWFALQNVGHSPLPVMILVPFLLFAEFLLYGQINDSHKKLTYVLMFYSLGLVVLAITVISTAGNGTPLWATGISFMGVCLFMLSDFNIARKTVGRPLYGTFFTQTTYILGQSLIVLGIAFLQCFRA